MILLKIFHEWFGSFKTKNSQYGSKIKLYCLFYVCLFITIRFNSQTLNTLFKVKILHTCGYLMRTFLPNFHNFFGIFRKKMSLFGTKILLSSVLCCACLFIYMKNSFCTIKTLFIIEISPTFSWLMVIDFDKVNNIWSIQDKT